MYIATRPVRFDRNYSIGEQIPENVINPGGAKRLIEAGKIQRVTVPEEDRSSANAPEVSPQTPQVESEGAEGITLPSANENGSVGAQGNAGESSGGLPFVCPVCGKICSTKTALVAHEKIHNK